MSLSDLRYAAQQIIADANIGLESRDVMPTMADSPTFAVLPKGWNYGETFDGAVDWMLELWIYVPMADDLDQAQRAYDAFMAPDGDSSIAALIEADPSMGLDGVTVLVSGAREYAKIVNLGGADMLGGYLDMLAMTK